MSSSPGHEQAVTMLLWVLPLGSPIGQGDGGENTAVLQAWRDGQLSPSAKQEKC